MSESPSTLRRISRMGAVDVVQLVRLAAMLVRIEVLLKRRPVLDVALRHGVHFLRDTAGEPSPAAPNLRYTPTEWRWVLNHKRLVKRWPWDKSCLRRSLLLGWILRSRDPDLMIGARADDAGEITAHAWIRLGMVDLDIEAQNYLTF